MNYKLTAAQQKVMDEAKKKIDQARMYNTMEDYYENIMRCGSYRTAQWMKENELETWEMYRDWWLKHQKGIVLIRANSKSLYKLESYGLINLIDDSKGSSVGIDIIQVRNY